MAYGKLVKFYSISKNKNLHTVDSVFLIQGPNGVYFAIFKQVVHSACFDHFNLSILINI